MAAALAVVMGVVLVVMGGTAQHTWTVAVGSGCLTGGRTTAPATWPAWAAALPAATWVAVAVSRRLVAVAVAVA